MTPPAATGLGDPLFVTDKSQAIPTGVTTLVLLLALLGSLVVAVTEEAAVIEAAATLDGTLSTTTISAEVLAANVGSLQVTVPVPPIAGDVQVQPAGARTD